MALRGSPQLGVVYYNVTIITGICSYATSLPEAANNAGNVISIFLINAISSMWLIANVEPRPTLRAALGELCATDEVYVFPNLLIVIFFYY